MVRFDERGFGLSDWDVADLGLEARIGDLEAVVEDCGVERFALMGMAQGGPVSIEYAARHPERVTRLLFYASYAATTNDPEDPEELELAEAFDRTVKVGWARPDSAFRRVFTTLMIPGATEEQIRWLDELQRVAVSTSTLLDARPERRRAETRHLLADLEVPTLVLHSRGDRMNALAQGRALASSIAGARLVVLESDNHILLADEPEWPRFVAEVRAFLKPDRERRPAACRPGARQRRDRRLSGPQRPHGRTPPSERLGQARRAGQVGPNRGGRAPAHRRLSPTRRPPHPVA